MDALAELHASELPAGITVADAIRIKNFDAGEVQSTVVPPGKKRECPAGRLLISSDYEKNPAKVALLDLDNLGGVPQFVVPPKPLYWEVGRRIKSNDHDLIVLPNGDVLLLKMGQSRLGLDPKPIWFDFAYKLSFEDDILTEAWGPGARSEILVWRSEDCGVSFEFVSAIDTAVVDDDYGTASDGSGGLPQRLGEDPPFVFLPTNPDQPVWQMGGTDGPLTRVDPATGRVFVTIGLVGQRPLSLAPEPFSFFLSKTPLDRTVVMMSFDRGETWERAAVLPLKAWRLDVVPRSNNTLAFADSGWDGHEGHAFVYPDRPIGFGLLPLADSPVFVAPEKNGEWGWNELPWDHPLLYKKKEEQDRVNTMKVNVHAQTILTRSPSSQRLVLAYPDTIGEEGDGYRLYAYDGQSSWLPFQPVAPAQADPANFVLHLTAVDPGQGPIAFYWYDADTDSRRVGIRGRLITDDNKETLDFVVSRRDGGDEYDFNVLKEARFYGDYHTSGAYVVDLSPGHDRSRGTYHYYPVWIEPDGDVRVAHVMFQHAIALPPPFAKVLGHRVLTGRDKLIQREEIDPSGLLLTEPEEEESPR